MSETDVSLVDGSQMKRFLVSSVKAALNYPIISENTNREITTT